METFISKCYKGSDEINMKVSVIIPNYNHAPYLEQRLDSVLNQTYTNFEVIILDDCSTDNSKEVIEKYRGHHKISQIVYNEQNSGSTFKQWQKGIALAQGEWIWIAESDDWCELSFLDELVGQIDDANRVDLIFCNSLRFQGDKILGFTGLRSLLKRLDGNEYITSRMIEGNTIMNASMALFRKSSYNEIPKDWMNYRFCGDWLFWIYIMKDAKIIEYGKVLNYYRTHEQNVSNKAFVNGDNEFERIKLWNRLYELNIITNYKKQKLQLNLADKTSNNIKIDSLTKTKIKKQIILQNGYYEFVKFKLKKLIGFKYYQTFMDKTRHDINI
jgi:glycosyltransferase involved in cell wall biosynthesis